MNLFVPKSKQDKLRMILGRSTKAVCGVQEREITVPQEKVGSTIRTLKAKGYVIIGTSFGKTKSKKIWFIPAGGF